MGKDFYFRPQSGEPLQLGELFSSTDEPSAGCLIANVQDVGAEIYAPEVNFYLRAGSAPVVQKGEDIQKLYEIRATIFDLARQTDRQLRVGRRLLIVSDEPVTDLQAGLEQRGFALLVVTHAQLVSLAGRIGEIRATVQSGEEELLLEADLLLCDSLDRLEPAVLRQRRGFHECGKRTIPELIDFLEKATNGLRYRNQLRYDPSLCLYHEKRYDSCGRCTSVCPTGAIVKKSQHNQLKNNQPQQLEIGDIDCIGCGACIAVCPTGALDSAATGRSTFVRLRSFFRDRVGLILPGSVGPSCLDVVEVADGSLPAEVLPLVLESDSLLDEEHLLGLLQTSGRPLIHYSEQPLSPVTENVFALINEIFQRKYGRPAILICSSPQELMDCVADPEALAPFDGLLYDPDERTLTKRQIIARRLQFLVGKDDFGLIHTSPHLRYGMLRLDQQRCTLCLSCADGCQTKALSVHPEDNTLRFTPSLCTCCGTCLQTCPENCLDLFADQLVLHPEFFRERVLARDELYACVECGKGFAPAKAIARIAAVMEPKFAGDSEKIKTLYCCPDCKAKVMIAAMHSLD